MNSTGFNHPQIQQQQQQHHRFGHPKSSSFGGNQYSQQSMNFGPQSGFQQPVSYTDRIQ